MSEPKQHVHLSADVAAPPDEVFTYFTAHFDDIWPGKLDHVRDAPEGSEPLGLGFVRRLHTPAGKIEEEIVTHDRPSLIEYKVINDVPIHNHLGRIEFAERNGGTRIDYTIDFDYKPSFLGPSTAGFMKVLWALRSKRRLAKKFPG